MADRDSTAVHNRTQHGQSSTGGSSMSLAGISAGSFFIDSDDESSASAATSAAVNLDGLHLAEEEAGEADGTPSAPAAARPIGAIDQQAEAGAGAAGEPEEGEPSETDAVLGCTATSCGAVEISLIVFINIRLCNLKIEL